MHTFVAKQVADRLSAPELDEERGNLYLGSTAPDIRVITRWERERTHFFDLNRFEEQSGVDSFLRAYPVLSDCGALTPATKSFVAGYITHLVMDEKWILSIYRPFFGKRSPMGGSLRANILDRAIQFSLDSERRSDTGLMEHVLEAVARSELDLDLEFIDGETLRRWQRVILDFVGRPPDWERFRQRAEERLRLDSGAEPESVRNPEELARSLPDLVDAALRYLTPRRIEECMRESLEGSLAAVREYLCA